MYGNLRFSATLGLERARPMRDPRVDERSRRAVVVGATEFVPMRSYYRTLQTAGHALRRNVMRSVLTCLGIIIGIAAVIAMMEIGQGSSYTIQQTITRMGANVVQIDP